MKGTTTLRDRIIGTATQLFHRQGYNQTGINQIIADSDIAYGSLYYNFKSKNELLAAYLERQSQAYFDGFEAFGKGIGNARQKLLRLIDYRIELQHPGFPGCPFTKIIAEIGTSDADVCRIVEQHKRKQKEHLYTLLANTTDQKSLSETLFLMIEGATVHSTVYRDTTAFEHIKKVIRKTIP